MNVSMDEYEYPIGEMPPITFLDVIDSPAMLDRIFTATPEVIEAWLGVFCSHVVGR